MNTMIDFGAALFEILLVAMLAAIGFRESASRKTREAPQRVRVERQNTRRR